MKFSRNHVECCICDLYLVIRSKLGSAVACCLHTWNNFHLPFLVHFSDLFHWIFAAKYPFGSWDFCLFSWDLVYMNCVRDFIIKGRKSQFAESEVKIDVATTWRWFNIWKLNVWTKNNNTMLSYYCCYFLLKIPLKWNGFKHFVFFSPKPSFIKLNEYLFFKNNFSLPLEVEDNTLFCKNLVLEIPLNIMV